VNTTMQRYSAFGLRIDSSIALRASPMARRGACDLSITCIDGPEPEWTATVREREHAFETDESEARFWFRNVGTFLVRAGRTVVVIPEHDRVDHTLLPLYVEGMIMAMALYQRGLSVLHASVVEIRGAAIACAGPIGAGKSSIAAAFYSRGYRILTDDNAAIRFVSGVPVVAPGYPYVKLFPSIAASLGFDAGDLDSLHETRSKMAGAVAKRFSNRPLPLRTVYILGRQQMPDAISLLSPLQATMQLILNAVPARWGYRGDARQLGQFGAIANQVPVFAVTTFRDIADLPSLVDTLEYHQTALEKRAAAPAPSILGELSSCERA
jgi:hypothetical protein